METSYQLFYRAQGEVEKMNLQATDKRMAKKFFSLLMPEAEIVYMTDDPIPMDTEYVENLMSGNPIN